MKNIFPLALIILMMHGAAVNAQQQQSNLKKQDESKIESISQQSGKLLIKEFIDIGTVQSVKVQILKISSSDGTTVSGVRLSYTYRSSYSSDEKVAFLDADELDGLIKSLEQLQSQVFATTPTNYTEVIFNSRSGFEAGAYWSGNKWKTFLQLEQYDSNSQLFMTQDDFASLLDLVKQVKGKMQ